ncbi:MAG: type IV pilus assembly protein PilM [Bacteriovoracaceae bacterium]|jgi:type IV pilus assembly protein PilM
MEKFNEFKVNFEKGQLIGIDIGLSAIKICVLSESKKGRFRLEKYESISLSEAAIIEDDIQKPEEVIEAIQTILKKQKIQKRIACIGLGGPNTVSKRLQVPDGVQDDVEDNIMWESEQYIPFGADDAEISFSILNRVEEEDVVDAIVGAARVDVIEKYMDYVKEAGLIVKIADLNVFSIINVFELIMEDKLEEYSVEGTIIIDFGAQYTSVIVYKNGGPILTKEVGIGGVLLTEEIQRTMGVSYEEAEDLKIHGDDNGNLPEEILGILETHNEKLMDELKKVLNFYIAAGSSEQVSYCFMTGGSSRLPGIKESLQDMIEIDVHELNPFDVIEVKTKIDVDELEEIANCGLVALGLGMRKI